MSGGKNILAGKKGREAPDFICGHTRILAINSIVHPHRMVNGHVPQFSSDSNLGNVYGRVNQNGVGHLDNSLDYTFSDAVLMSSNSSNSADLLVLFN